MKITKLSLRRYRAFDSEVTIPLSDFTVLVGPNNLGKSTVLRALDLFFSALSGRGTGRSGLGRRPGYSVAADYPKRYLGRKGRRWPTVITVEVAVTPEEVSSYEAYTHGRYHLPSPLQVKMEFKVDAGFVSNELQVAGIVGDDTVDAIAIRGWLGANMRYVYIPATRNIEDFRRSVFAGLVEGALQTITNRKQRMASLKRVYADIETNMRRIEQDLAGQLMKYAPDVKSVKFVLEEPDFDNLLSVNDVEIDDGANTALSQKGDGFKSLFALSLLQFMAERKYGINLVFGIEEPESHLHANAIYAVKSTLRELSRHFQVILTTHSPILLQRDSVGHNIIVNKRETTEFSSSATPARSLREIQECLGIRPQENLTSAAVTILVEGATEEACLAKLLSASNSRIESAFREGTAKVLCTRGVSRVSALLRVLSRDASACIVLLDSDEAGRAEKERVLKSGLIGAEDVFSIPDRPGCRETEFEDMFDPRLYVDQVAMASGIVLDAPAFDAARTQSGSQRTKTEKWSTVMSNILSQNGKSWDDLEKQAKSAFGKAIEAKAGEALASQPDFLRSLAARAAKCLEV